MAAFTHRGVVEGFYGTPWSHEDRLWMLGRLGSWGMNRYVYAPKDDPLHRSEWRTPYPAETLADFAELVEQGGQVGVGVGFALSPGLSISYASADDRGALVDKFRTLYDTGARFLALALDDVPTELAHEADQAQFDSLGAAHVELAAAVRDAFPDACLWVVPTDYLGTDPSEYLSTLGEGLDPSVEVGWTGRTIVSPTIRASEAARRSAALGRKLLVWDNVPVSDGPMRNMLHLGPFGGREPGLVEHTSGFLLNPMEHAHASAVALCSAAEWLRDPQSYDPERAWERALDEAGAGDPEAFRTFAFAHRFSPLWPDDRDAELESAFGRLLEELEAGGDLVPPLDELRARTEVRLAVAERLRSNLVDRKLASEIEPWLASHERETRCLDAAVGAAATLVGDGSRSEKAFALMGIEARFTREPANGRTSYGPRRVFYPQLVAMGTDEMSFGDDPSLIRDRNLADELIEFVEDLGVWLLTHFD